jgi:hypothetical protein
MSRFHLIEQGGRVFHLEQFVVFQEFRAGQVLPNGDGQARVVAEDHVMILFPSGVSLKLVGGQADLFRRFVAENGRSLDGSSCA